jgi:hypothetical protein
MLVISVRFQEDGCFQKNKYSASVATARFYQKTGDTKQHGRAKNARIPPIALLCNNTFSLDKLLQHHLENNRTP